MNPKVKAITMNVFPSITSRLMLRPFERRDLVAFAAYRNHPDVARYQSWSSYSIDEARAFFAQQEGLAFGIDDTWFQIAAERSDNGVLVGDIAVHFFDDGRQAELGFTFDPAQQRRGYAQEAVTEVIRLLFTEQGKHRLVATVDVLNAPAIRLLERQGFCREGHYRKNIWFKGAWGDEYSYALLNEEWQARQGSEVSARDA
jgi:RimJ/RimL family protein N-acetyltransferase